MESKGISISSHRAVYRSQVDLIDSSSEDSNSIDSSSEKNSVQPKWVTPSELMKMLEVDEKSISGKDWALIEGAAKEGIKVLRYTDSGQPVLKFDANSPLTNRLMAALGNVGDTRARCKLAGMIEPSARIIPLIRLLKDIKPRAGTLTPVEKDLLQSALVGSCKYIIKKASEVSLLIKDVSKEDVFTLISLCPTHLKGQVVGAGVLALLPVGRDTSVKLLSRMTSEERSAAYAIAIATARSQPKQMDALNKLHTKLSAKFPIMGYELALAINDSYKQALLPGITIAAYPAVESSAVNWGEVIESIKTAATDNVPLKEEPEKWESAIAAVLKDGLTIVQLEELADAVKDLSLTTDRDRMVLSRRLGARLLEAVPYMKAPPEVEEFDRIVGIVPFDLDADLTLFMQSFCFSVTASRFSALEAAQRRAQKACLPLDFVSAIPKCLPGLKFTSETERASAYKGALANPNLNGNTLRSTVLAMGWPADSSFCVSVGEFGDLLQQKDYKEAEKILTDLVDPIFLAAATEKLEELKAAKSNAPKRLGQFF